MKLWSKLGAMFSAPMSRLGLSGATASGVAGRTVEICEHLAGALAATLLFGMVQRFLPLFVPPVALVAVTMLAFWPLARKLRLGLLAFVSLSSFYFFLTQPMLAIGLGIVSGVAAGGTAAYFSKSWKAKALAGVGSALAVGGITIGVEWALLVFALPALHGVTVSLYNLSPPVVAWLCAAPLAYWAWRRQQPAGRNWQWVVATAMCSLFLAYCWPVHSLIAQAVSVLVALAIITAAVFCRPMLSAIGSAGAAVAFTALFLVSQTWTGFYEYQMARALDVEYTDHIEDTSDSRMVPRLAATDYCSQQNRQTFVDISPEAHPIVIEENGERKFYWSCLRHPARLRGHLLYVTGGVDGIILADAGERGRFGHTIEHPFFFGDASVYTAGAFAARHPGAIMQPPLPARTVDGDWYILVPYVSRVMQWGAMIPDLSGVMAISPNGFIQDYTPAQAARKFPGVPIMPTALAREYANVWGHHRTLSDLIWFGDLFEVSEFNDGDEQQNRYPFWQDFEGGAGLRGVIPFEPVGKHQNVVAGIGLFDPYRLRMTFVDSPGTRGPGPKQIAANVAVSHPGLYNVKTIEALLVVRDGKIFWLTSLVNPQKTSLHGYGYNVLYDRNAQNWCDVDSRDAIRRCVDQMLQGHALNAPVVPTPVPTPVAPIGEPVSTQSPPVEPAK